MALIVMRKGGGGKVAINPEMVNFVRSATGAFTDIFVGGQQVAVEGTFEQVVGQLQANPRQRSEPAPTQPANEISYPPRTTVPFSTSG